MSGTNLFADDPIDGSDELPDRLDRQVYATHVVALLDRVRRQSVSSVLALIGSWGSGKSSVLDMVARKLSSASRTADSAGKDVTRADGDWLVARFNPWTYGSVDSLLIGFFDELRAVLPKDDQWSEKRSRIGAFGKAIAPYAGLIPGLNAEGALVAVSEAIAGDQGAEAKKAAAEEVLREFGRPILFIMDDLDRLTPDELLMVFKLVRLVGRMPNIYYLLCYDEVTLLDVLSRTDLVPLKATADSRRARDYLEKIIQVRLDLPALRESQALTMIDECINQVIDANNVQIDDGNFERFRTAFHEHIQKRLTTPRAINRYFAQVEALYVLLGQEIDFVDFLLLTWVRTAEPELYAHLQGLKDELTASGMGSFLSSGQKESYAEALDRWSKALAKAGVATDDVDGVLAVLGQMFLPIRSARTSMGSGSTSMDDIRVRRGVGHVDYFDRYFSFGVPEEDIADSTVRTALVTLAAGEDSDEVGELRSKLLSDTARVCRKLKTAHEQGRVPAATLLIFLSGLYSELSDTGDIFVDARRTVQYLASDVLPDVSSGEGAELLRRMCESKEGVALMANAVSRAEHGTSTDSGMKSIDWLDQAKQDASGLIRLFFDGVTVGLEELSEELWRTIWSWRWIDHEALREWLRAAALSKDGWSVEEVLARCVQPARMDGFGFPALDMAEVEPLLGVEFALEHLQPLNVSERLLPSIGLEVTWQNRIRIARTLLDVERERRATEATEGGVAPESSSAAADATDEAEVQGPDPESPV